MKTILVQDVNGQTLVSNLGPTVDAVICAMEARGYEFIGLETRGYLREELRGAPRFKGLLGPCYGGPETPWRYETWAVAEELSR